MNVYLLVFNLPLSAFEKDRYQDSYGMYLRVTQSLRDTIYVVTFSLHEEQSQLRLTEGSPVSALPSFTHSILMWWFPSWDMRADPNHAIYDTLRGTDVWGLDLRTLAIYVKLG